jgi:hypothetical protein
MGNCKRNNKKGPGQKYRTGQSPRFCKDKGNCGGEGGLLILYSLIYLVNSWGRETVLFL